jgi:hypothetical protein
MEKWRCRLKGSKKQTQQKKGNKESKNKRRFCNLLRGRKRRDAGKENERKRRQKWKRSERETDNGQP